LQAVLQPGQRLVSIEGDVWRWDGFRAASEDAPSAAALRLQQLNRLVELKRDLEDAAAKAQGAAQAHEQLTRYLAKLTEADHQARAARREADRLVAEANRAASRAEADRNLAKGKLESLGLAVNRHVDEAMAARRTLSEAEQAAADLGDLGDARAQVEDIKMTVEAARITMMSRRSAHDELRREGDARLKRSQEITKEVSGWKHRLETAGKRTAELSARRQEAEASLKAAEAAPVDIAAERESLSRAIEEAEARRGAATDRLAAADTALREASIAEREAERAASEARQARARSDAQAEAARETVVAAADRIREAMDVTAEGVLDSLGGLPDERPGPEKIEGEVDTL